MTKKLTLIAIALMAIAPLANADMYNPGQYIDVQAPDQVNIGEAFNVNIVVGQFADLASFSGSGASLAKMAVSNATITGASINASAGWADLPSPLISHDGSVLTIEAGVGTTPIAKGTLLFSFTLEAGSDTITIDSSAGNWAGYSAVVGPFDGFNTGDLEGQYPTYTAGYKEVAVVPEPMTMGLLGLGGLFLARHKKA